MLLPNMNSASLDRWYALGLSIALSLHNIKAYQDGRWYDWFWLCNISVAVLACGFWLRSKWLTSASGIWIIPGSIVWLLDSVLSGAHILPTSYAVHLGGSALACVSALRFGSPKRSWLAALALLGITICISRFALPEAANVNAAHAIPKGWGLLGKTRLEFSLWASVLAGLCAWLVGLALYSLGRFSRQAR